MPPFIAREGFSVLKGFFWGGFEDAAGLNSRRAPIDKARATGHNAKVADDYRPLRAHGVRVARAAIPWPQVDRGDGRYDFSSVDGTLAAASTLGLQLVFDLFHLGYPEDADPFHPDFPLRYAEYARAVAEYVATYADGPYVFMPLSEPSYLAWAGGDAGFLPPYAHERSYEMKEILARYAIAGIDAIRSVILDARFVNVDPLCRVVAPEGLPDLADEAQAFNERVVPECLDMIAGLSRPEFGGSLRHLDVVGLNYHDRDQWELVPAGGPAAPDDPRAWSLSDLMRWAYHRYRCEIVLAGPMLDRGDWLDHIADEATQVIDEGIPLRGVCLPVLGLPPSLESRPQTALWNVDSSLQRVPNTASIEALRRAQDRLEGLRFSMRGVPHALIGEGWLL